MVPCRNNTLIVHELDDEVLLYDPQIDRSHRLNVSAAFIWRSCDGRLSADDIARLMTTHFDVAYDVAHHDAQRAIDQLVEEQVLSCAQA